MTARIAHAALAVLSGAMVVFDVLAAQYAWAAFMSALFAFNAYRFLKKDPYT